MQGKKKLLLILIVAVAVILGLYFEEHFFSKNTFGNRSLCKDCNILLISLDTCGAKHMSTYGYERDTTPNLSKLAEQGILFENAYANATWSLPAHVSMFTGLYSFVHNVIKPYDSLLSESLPFLPELLQKNGYETYFYAPHDEAIFSDTRVYTRGISYWDPDYWKYREREVEYLSLAINQIKKNNTSNKKSFVFLHSNMCHSPYFTGDEPLLYTEKTFPWLPLKVKDVFDAPFTPEYYQYLLRRLPVGLADGDFRRNPEKIEALLYELKNAPDFQTAKRAYENAENNGYWGEVGMDDYKEKFEYWNKIDSNNSELVDYLEALYDQKLHKADTDVLGYLREQLQNETWKNNTIIIITSGHGEEFMEHGAIGHTTLYDFNAKIPLVFLVPRMQSIRATDNVQQVDITPTLLDLIGIPYKGQLNGVSLTKSMQGESLPNRVLIAGGDILFRPDLTTVREGNWKLFISERDDSLLPYALYNTADDPEEQRDVLKEQMGKAALMIQKLKTEKEKELQFEK